ncbi:zinc finger protein 37-like isoform X4 [Venturia canescens]|uniref:zinc finger protein 37-like isoform X4 n=1 Tax=Venturia canescens TaxID=32260 RepID=UPI001C9CDC5A|nr:zinc finger protein 37-like isoform X4 [Venturia canescens]
MSSLDYLDLCRLCLVKDRVSVPIFEGEGDVRQIFLKIAACLPVKVGREDKLPKKICDDCVYKVELFYQFWNTTANAEKQLLQWLGEVSMDDKQGYVTGAHDPSMMKPGQNTGENRLDGSSVMQQVNEHTNNMGMGMMDGMGIGMPMMIPNSGQQPQQQQMTSVPMDTGGNAVQNVQPVPGPSAQIGQQKINAPTNEDEDEDESEEEDNSDDECDGDDGLPVKEESEDEPNRTIEPTTFVNVSLACDEAGPSGLQQQKIGEMPEMVMPPTDGDPKSGYITPDPLGPDYLTVKIMDDFYRIPKSKCYMMLTRPTSGEKSTLDDKNLRKDLENSVDNVDTCIDRETVSLVRLKSSEVPSSKLECSSDLEVASEPTRTRRKRRMNEKRDRGKKKSHEHEETRENEKAALDNSYEKRNPEDRDNVPLDDREMRRKREKNAANDRTEENSSNDYLSSGSMDSSREAETAETESSNNKKKCDKKSPSMPYECEPCGYKFSRKWKYERHMNSHSRKKAESPNFECAPCGKNFTRPSAYKQHMLKHSNEKPHKCDVCEKAFKRPYELKMHRDIHSGSMHTCDICSFSTAYKVSLMVHKKRVHQKIYRHKCEQCEKAFMSKHELEDHRTCHLGEKSFICEICGNGFLQRSYLVHHKRVVHGVHNRAPMELKCEKCDKTFATKYCLQNHVGIHSQKFLCSQCGKEFATNYSLRMHNRMHTGERPHKCNMCSKSFARSNALAVHKLTHTGQRPYVCDICDKTFTQRTTMMAHRRKHPGSHPPPPRTSLVELANAGDSNS